MEGTYTIRTGTAADRIVEMAELYDLKNDPGERVNRISDPAAAAKLAELKEELKRLMTGLGLTAQNDRMPIDEGIRKELPDQKIR